VVGSSLGATDGTTFNPGDNLSGGGGTDSLNVSVSGTHAANLTVSAFTLNGIERMMVANYQSDDARDTIFNMANATGLTTIGISGSSASGDTQFTAVKNIVSAEMNAGAGDLSITYLDTAVSGTADTQNLTLSGVTAGTFTVAPTSTGGIETLAITSSGGTRNVLTGITNQTGLATITVAGDTAATLGTLGAAVTSVNASSNTGGITATMSATTTTAVTGSSGNDSITLGAVLTTGSVNAGNGTDTLVTGSDTYIATSALGAKFTNFEVLSVTAATDGGTAATTSNQDVSFVSGITTINATATRADAGAKSDTTHAINFTNLSGTTNTLNITGMANADATATDDFDVTVTATRASNTSSDAMTVNLGTSTAVMGTTATATGTAAAGGNTVALSLANEESITFNSLGGSTGTNFLAAITSTSATSMTFTGARALSFASISGTSTASINASAMTGALIMGTNAATVASTIQGGSGNDTLTGGSAADSIVGNAGLDSITGAAGNDTISGGDGNDTIDAGSGVDNVSGGDGDDTINVTTTTDFIGLTAAETVSGGAGNDNLVISQAATAITLAATDLTGLSSIDRITINGTSGAGSITLTDAVYTANGISELRIIDGDLTTAGGTLTVTASALTGTNAIHVTANTATGINDTLTGGAGNDTFVFSTVAGLEATDTVVGGAGTDTISLTATAAVTANLTGVRTVERVVTTGNGGDVSITVGNDAVLAASTSITVDATSVTNSAFDLLYDGSAITTATKAQNVTGTAGNDTITGGSGNDTITGGDSADTITGGAGIDRLFGGEGNDTFSVAAAAQFIGLDAAETVSGGNGIDILSISVGGASIAVGSADLLGLSSVERINITNADTRTATLVLSDAVYTANGVTAMTVVNNITANTDDGISVTASSLGAANSIAFTGASAAGANESVVGGAGNDSFTFTTLGLDGTTGGGDNIATAYDANDTVNGGAGSDTMTINTGTTALTAATLTNVSNIERLVVSGTTGGTGLLTLADANFATVTGATIDGTALTTGALLVTAAAEDDSTFNITGGGGADSMIGGQLADTINGGAGDDTIQGGLLADSLTGGSGADVFQFTAVAQSNSSNTDSITDFTSGTDKLNVTLDYSTSLVAVTVDGTVQTARAGTTLIQDNLSGARGQAAYDTTGSALYVNVNADNLLTTSDYKININPAATATATIAEGDINFTVTGTSAADTITTGGGADTITSGGGDDSITAGAGVDTITATAGGTIDGGAGSDLITLNGAGNYIIKFMSSTGSDTITNTAGWATGGNDKIQISMAAFGAGNADTTINNGAAVTGLAGGGELAVNAELGVITTNVTDGVGGAATDLTAATAAAVAGAMGALLAGNTAAGVKKILAFDDGVDTAVFLFTSAANDASILAAELTLIGFFSGVAATATADYVFIA
jgi:trimeric autotransporter adhesin